MLAGEARQPLCFADDSRSVVARGGDLASRFLVSRPIRPGTHYFVGLVREARFSRTAEKRTSSPDAAWSDRWLARL